MKGLIIIPVLTIIFSIIILFSTNKIVDKNPNYNIPILPNSPISKINWFHFPPLKNLSDPSWGNVLTDIENHLHPSFGDQYRSVDKVTWTHETTHGINSYLNNNFARKIGSYGLYVGDNKAILIKQPNIKISTIAENIKQNHKKRRYQLYFVSQQREWNNDPIYIYDEWICYTNGAACFVEMGLEGRDSTWACLEFSVYAIYLCMTTEKYDPNYDSKQLLAFTAWNLERAMNLYHRGFNWDNHQYLEEIRNSTEIREYCLKTWGKTFF